jgi:hypothetical protein
VRARESGTERESARARAREREKLDESKRSRAKLGLVGLEVGLELVIYRYIQI